MNCPRCQAENPPGMKFCGQCAAALAAVCPSCGTANPPGNKFCGQCATPLGKGAEPRFAAPDSYTPRHLAERIINSKAALEGERKQVTVLFADLKGSMELLADRDPEEARKLLDAVIEHMMEAVHRYEGTVNQVMGDGIMALFGAPLAHEDHAVRASYAALWMRNAIERYSLELRARKGIDVQVRIGLNSGEVVVRSIRSDLHMDYSAVGSATHLAARMEQLARPGTILLTHSTLSAVEGFVEVKPLGSLPVKGVENPVPVYELVSERSARTRIEAVAAVRGLTRFVGRGAEMGTLVQLLGSTDRGHGQLIAIIGEPGIGKSRLAYEFMRIAATRGCLILEGRAASYGKQTAYLPVVELLKTYFGVGIRDTAAQISDKLLSRLGALDKTLLQSVAAIQFLLDVPADDPRWMTLDPRVRRQRTLDTLKQLVLRESQVQPVMLVFEDLHWIDPESQAILDALVETVPTARILLLVMYRPEYEHRWSGRTFYTQLRIDPLESEMSEELLDNLVGTDGGLRQLKCFLIQRTEGNPLFLEESVKALVESRAIVVENGRHQLISPIQKIAIPASVHAVLAARIDRLLPEDKAVLQAAAVVGRDVPYLLLECVVAASAGELDGAVQRLLMGEFLYETKAAPEREYTFKHSLTHDVAYEGLLHDYRRALHAATMSAIERLYPGRIAEHVESLARHAVRGEVWDKAVTYLRQAAYAAATRSAYREASNRFRSAIAALENLPTTHATTELGIDMRFELRTSLLALGDHRPIFEILKDTDRMATSLGDERRLAWSRGYQSMASWWAADYANALAAGQQALGAAEGLADRGLEALSLVSLGWVHHALGDFRAAIDVLRRVWEASIGERKDFAINRGSPVLAVMALSWLTCSHAELGEFDVGLQYGEEATNLAQKANHPWSRVAAYYGLGLLHTRQGNLDSGIAILELGLHLCESHDIPGWGTTLAWELGHAAAVSGDPARGVRLLDRAVQEAEAAGSSVHQSLRLGWLAEAELLAAGPVRASDLGRQALELARHHRERAAEAHVLRILGDVAAMVDDPTTALAHYDDAVALAAELGMRPLQAQCLHGVGLVCTQRGDSGHAAIALRRSAELFESMAMVGNARRAQSALLKLLSQ